MEAVASLTEAKESAFEELARFLGPEPVVELLPYHFLPESVRGAAGLEALQELAVAGKIIHAQVRWLDKIADEPASRSNVPDVHRLNEALGALAGAKFRAVLGDTRAALFFSVLAQLYARYGASLAVDQGTRGLLQTGPPLNMDQYVEHAKARAAPVRAPVEAVLLLVNATEDQFDEARSCFEWWAAGLQLYDDALDVEEDFREGRLSWVVSHTLVVLRERGSREALDPDLFYETALVEGLLNRNLIAAEALFRKALDAAVPRFPGCADYLRATLQRTKRYRLDLERLVAS